MGYAAAIKRMYKKHDIMFVVAVQKLVKHGMTEKDAIKYLKG